MKNSSLIAREQNTEYDPSHISVPDRPLATGRSFHGRSRSDVQSPRREAPESPQQRPVSPSKDQPSPPKSSLSKATRFGHKLFDPESDIWSDVDDGPSRFSERNPKSVTFDAAPPQVNEYEMTTPDISSLAESREGSYEFDEDEIDISFDRGSSLDRDDSFDASLEDIEKTPVVLPEDWRFMSPDSANDDLVSEDGDPFVDHPESPGPDVQPMTHHDTSAHGSRIDSLDSNGEKRPLPPLPNARCQDQSPRLSSPDKLSAAFERAASGQRVLPSPPGPASYSKNDIVGSGRPSMNLEDRLRLMMLQERDDNDQQLELERQKERRMRRAGARERSAGSEYEDRRASESIASQIDTPPHISREDILRNLKSREDLSYDDEEDDDVEGDYSSQFNSSPPPHTQYDPDVPIPSLEDHMEELDVQIKDEPLSDDEGDMYDIPEYFGPNAHGLPLPLDEDRLGGDEDDESNYSQNSRDTIKQERDVSAETTETDVTTVHVAEREDVKETVEHDQVSSETGTGTSNGFEHLDFGLANIPEPLQRPQTPEKQTGEIADEPSTPDSVIRHPVDEESEAEESDYETTPEPVSELVATIKAPGTGLKTRPSLTPADVQSMAAVRRKVSVQSAIVPVAEEAIESTQEDENEQESHDGEQANDILPTLTVPEVSQRQSSLVKLDIPFNGSGEGLDLGLDKEFDRVIEAQKVAFDLALSRKAFPSSPTPNPLGTLKEYPLGPIGHLNPSQFGTSFANKSPLKQRGYLMRQNTKVIIASSNANDETQTAPQNAATKNAETKPENTSPRKASQPTWTAEPWNGKMRRQSSKAPGAIKKKPVPGAVPPLPGMPSNVQDVQQSIEEVETEQPEDDQERGRLFVKVVGVRDLDLPLPKSKLSYHQPDILTFH